MTQLAFSAWVCAGIALAVWIASLISREYSWTDRIWSIAPIAYVWIFAADAGAGPRSYLIAVLVTAWGARLTYNFWRKGGYQPGGEDYRWGYIRSKVSPGLFQVFNLLFIAAYQNLLIWLMTVPAWTVARNPAPLNVWDWLVAAAFLAALAGETIADQQQWRFHQVKRTLAASGQVPDPPFCDTGLFAWSRHPNYFFEQAQWWLIYCFAITATGHWLHWSIAGAVLVTLLFIGSTVITEHISGEKYPQYAAYRKRVSGIVPLPPRLTGRKVSAEVRA